MKRTDASKMRRAGKPSVDPKRGSKALSAYDPADFSNTLRTKSWDAYPDNGPVVGRVITQLRGAVESLHRENQSQVKLEQETAQTFDYLCAQVASLQRAFTTLADAVIDELDAVRDDQAQFRQERDEWTKRVMRIERDVQKRVTAVDSWQRENDAIRNDLLVFKSEQAAVNDAQVDAEAMRDDLEALREEMTVARDAVAEARAALAEAERREAEMSRAMHVLQRKAESGDLKLQEQVNALRAAVAEAATTSDGGGNATGLGVGNAATEADVVALRDWTRTVTAGHDQRLRRIEVGLNAMAMSERGGSVGGSVGGWGSRGPSQGPTPRVTPKNSPLKGRA